jgi:rhodanese-related sulfurtransferase
MSNTISRTELQTILSNIVVLEALPERYYADGHLPGARRIDVQSAVADAARIVADKAAPVVVYCASSTCQNSHQVAGALERAGYTNVRVYAEGKADWSEAGLPLER